MTERIGGFELIAPVGSGSSAEVWQAKDHKGKVVALKILHRSLLQSAEDCERFLHEAELAQRLDHPNIMKVLNSGEHEGRPFLVLEFLEGVTLAQKLADGLPIRLGLELLAQVAEGLSEAHNCGLIHRDLKPANIFITSDGRAKVTDWGMAKSHEADKNLTKTGIILGTPQYISPEQIIGKKLDGRCDLYALGVMAFELCADRLPFIKRSLMQLVQAHLKESPPKLKPLCPPLPAPLITLIEDLLVKEPQKRPAKALKVAKKIRQLLPKIESGLYGGRRAAASVAKEERPKPNRFIFSLALTFVLLSLFLSFFYWRDSRARAATQINSVSLDGRQRLTLRFSGNRSGKLIGKILSEVSANSQVVEFDLLRATKLATGDFQVTTVLPFLATEAFEISFFEKPLEKSFKVDPQTYYKKVIGKLKALDEQNLNKLLLKILKGNTEEALETSGVSLKELQGLGQWLHKKLPKNALHTHRLVQPLDNLRLIETAIGLAGDNVPWLAVEKQLHIDIVRYSKFKAPPKVHGWQHLAHLQLARIVGVNPKNDPVTKSFWMGTKGFVTSRAKSHYARGLVVKFWAIDVREKLVPYSSYKTIEKFELNIEQELLEKAKQARFSLDVLHVDQRTLVKLRINGTPLLLPLNPIHFGRLPSHSDRRAWLVSLGISPRILRPGKNSVIIELVDFPHRVSDLGFGLRSLGFWYQ